MRRVKAAHADVNLLPIDKLERNKMAEIKSSISCIDD